MEQTYFRKGFGLKKGAIASSVSHDSHNIVVIGTHDGDMYAAAVQVVKMQGGIVAALNGQVLEALPLPVAGLMSDQPYETVRERLIPLRAAAKALGGTLDEPFLQLAFLPLPVIPHLKISDRGMVDVDAFEIIVAERGNLQAVADKYQFGFHRSGAIFTTRAGKAAADKIRAIFGLHAAAIGADNAHPRIRRRTMAHQIEALVVAIPVARRKQADIGIAARNILRRALIAIGARLAAFHRVISQRAHVIFQRRAVGQRIGRNRRIGNLRGSRYRNESERRSADEQNVFHVIKGSRSMSNMRGRYTPAHEPQVACASRRCKTHQP